MRQVLKAAASIALFAAVILAVAHVIVRPVHPEQPVPERHPPGPCWLCHLVTPAAELVED